MRKGKCFDLLSNFPNKFFKEMYWDQSGEFACEYLVSGGSRGGAQGGRPLPHLSKGVDDRPLSQGLDSALLVLLIVKGL